MNEACEKSGVKTQMEVLDDAIEECIQRFKDETTGTGIRVLIVEFEELILLRTKLLTQMVIADQQVKHIFKRYKYQPKEKIPKEKKRKLEFQPLNISNVEKSGKAENAAWEELDCAYKKADRNSKMALGITVAAFALLILAHLDKIISFVCYALSYLH